MKSKLRKLNHWAIRGILYLMWAAIVVQAVVYFVNPIRAQTYARAVNYWTSVWGVLFGG